MARAYIYTWKMSDEAQKVLKTAKPFYGDVVFKIKFYFFLANFFSVVMSISLILGMLFLIALCDGAKTGGGAMFVFFVLAVVSYFLTHILKACSEGVMDSLISLLLNYPLPVSPPIQNKKVIKSASAEKDVTNYDEEDELL